MKPNPLIGKTITAVFLAEDQKAIRLDIEGGEPIIVKADGDCCSSTWIAEIQGLEQLIGSPVVGVEDVPMRDKEEREEDEVIAFYGCKITTEKGYALIDYRNESNGYYGGNLAWPHEDCFYGGVYGQNISKEVWKPVQ